MLVSSCTASPITRLQAAPRESPVILIRENTLFLRRCLRAILRYIPSIWEGRLMGASVAATKIVPYLQPIGYQLIDRFSSPGTSGFNTVECTVVAVNFDGPDRLRDKL